MLVEPTVTGADVVDELGTDTDSDAVELLAAASVVVGAAVATVEAVLATVATCSEKLERRARMAEKSASS